MIIQKIPSNEYVQLARVNSLIHDLASNELRVIRPEIKTSPLAQNYVYKINKTNGQAFDHLA